jgi:hypothetical protein
MCAGLLKSDPQLDVEEVYDWMVVLLHLIWICVLLVTTCGVH